jgi:hypothetical protein
VSYLTEINRCGEIQINVMFPWYIEKGFSFNGTSTKIHTFNGTQPIFPIFSSARQAPKWSPL